MPDDVKNPPVGTAACHDCGEDVTARLNSNHKTYYFCHCGAHHRWSFKHSNAMKKAAAIHGAGNIRFVAAPDGELICEVPTPTTQPEPGPGHANDNPDGADAGPDTGTERRRGRFRR